MRADDAAWVQEMVSFILQKGASPRSGPFENEFEIDTPTAGTLTIHLTATRSEFGRKGESFRNVFMRFTDPERARTALPGAALLGDLNRFSGKWNIHFGGPVSSDMAKKILGQKLAAVGVP